MQLAGLKGGLSLVHKCCCRSSRRVGRTFSAMTPAQASVGIIGGGLAGTSCAGALADHGIRCHIFDMGFSGPGGRSSTRVREQYQYDHGCQYVAVPEGLKATFSQLERAGAATEWQGRFGTLDGADGALKEAGKQDDAFCDFGSASMFIGTPGMSSICHQLSSHDAITTHWASKVSAIEHADSSWSVKASPKAGSEAGQTLTTPDLDAIVLADIMVTQQGSSMLKRVQGIGKVPVFALMITYDTLQQPFDAAQIASSPVLKLITCNSAKPGRQCPPGHSSWVALSTSEWARQFLQDTAKEAGRQLPAKELTGRAQAQLVQEFEAIMRRAGWPTSAKAVHMETQRWGSAFKADVIDEPCLWDSEVRVGMCGDFCQLSSAAGAMLSGLALAERLKQALA